MKSILVVLLTAVLATSMPAQCWQSISIGSQHTAALKSDGSLWTWGNNDVGQLGDNSIMETNLPVEVTCPPSGIINMPLLNYHVQVSPNPAQNYLAIHIMDINTTDLYLEVRNTLGEVIAVRQNSTPAQEINIEDLVPGLYFLIITNKNDRTVKPFVKI